jgi:hypothetical protein
MWHSCGRHTIAEHFAGKAPQLQAVWRRFVAVARENGPVTVYAQKTRIVMQVRARFAGASVRKNWLECAVPFQRRVESPRFIRIDDPTRTDGVHWLHYFTLASVEEVDDEVRAWLREAYKYGSQARLAARAAQPQKNSAGLGDR